MKNIWTHIFGLIIITQAYGQSWEREEIEFNSIQSRAIDLASKPYVAPSKKNLPKWIRNLDYDKYRDIRFNVNQALWSTDEAPFRAMLFHPGYLYDKPVTLHEFTKQHQQQIRFSEAYFNYGPLLKKRGKVPSNIGFSGFRLHSKLNKPNYYDELIAFQGSSYWRALGKGQIYGISARGLALNSGIGNVQEEFPYFKEFWLSKPHKSDTFALVYALLDSPSYTGAYAFKISPGNDTIVDVQMVIYCREEVERVGIAPMSSMYWFGENSRKRYDDFRPEVHDSDGLAIRMGSGERLWRPLSNDSKHLEFSFFNMERCNGFGLLQRDRSFSSYEDAEASYHSRPSLWIEPTSDWGPGKVILMEIPTDNEVTDNSVAMWEPKRKLVAGDRVEFSYRQHWTMDPDPAVAEGYVVATRTGKQEPNSKRRVIIVEYQGAKLEELEESLVTADVKLVGEHSEQIAIQDINVEKIPSGRWRLSFYLAPTKKDESLSNCRPVELRCCLKRGENYLTETWAYRIQP